MIHLVLVHYFILVFACHAEAPCVEGDMHHLSTHTETHTSAFAPSGLSLCTRFADPVISPVSSPLGPPGITVMNGPEAPRKDALPTKEIHAAAQGVRSVGETVKKPKQSIL